MTTKVGIASVLEDYLRALRQPDGAAAVVKAESMLLKKGLDAQLSGKQVLLMHYQEQLARVKRRGAVNGNIEVYSEDFYRAEKHVTIVTQQIQKLEKRIAKRDLKA